MQYKQHKMCTKHIKASVKVCIQNTENLRKKHHLLNVFSDNPQVLRCSWLGASICIWHVKVEYSSVLLK